MSVMRARAFTLIEILIVVVILGILSAVVVPQFTGATDAAERTATLDQLCKLREAIDLYHVRNGAQYPNIVAGSGESAWGELIGPGYMRAAGINSWVGGAGAQVVVIGNAADGSYQQAHGWIWDPAAGVLRAGSYDDDDQPYPKP
jgi:prepilin-type N-terminal cleavage/methylation domain-containing protein